MRPHADVAQRARAPSLVAGPAADARAAAGRVGPNAIIQTRRVLARRLARADVERLFLDAGLAAYAACDPSDMVDASEAGCLFAAIRDALSAESADDVLREAGHLTGDYILAHRIPKPAAFLLRALPARWAGPLLLRAVAAHAWTFAGAGRVTIRERGTLAIDIAGNPLATPGCPWHLGVLGTLFATLASKSVSLRHTRCCARGDASCLTEIRL